jgi:beta-phosphoglucomutase-like phosphatase (HAD superfamily)
MKTSATGDRRLIVEDLLKAIKDKELFDVNLIASDGVQVPAPRLALAARSGVLKRMLYGPFREARTSAIDFK